MGAMNNVITITLKEGQNDRNFRIDFKENPSISELVTAKLVIEEVLEHNFKKADILLTQGLVYPKLENIEEVYKEEE